MGRVGRDRSDGSGVDGSPGAHEGEAGEPGAAMWPRDGDPRGGAEARETAAHSCSLLATAKPIFDKRLRRLLRKLEIAAVPHGFRSSFRDWAVEETDHPREVVEAALAHVVRNKVEAAYRRSDLFERRRQLMDDWAAYLAGDSRDPTVGTVLPLRGTRPLTGATPRFGMPRSASGRVGMCTPMPPPPGGHSRSISPLAGRLFER